MPREQRSFPLLTALTIKSSVSARHSLYGGMVMLVIRGKLTSQLYTVGAMTWLASNCIKGPEGTHEATAQIQGLA